MDVRTEGQVAFDILLEAATAHGYGKGFWAADRSLADWKAGLDGMIDRWASVVNPAYLAWADCVYGMFILAVEDEREYARLVGDVAGEDSKTFEGLSGLCSFLQSLADDHDYTIDPRGSDGVRLTFDGPIGEDGVTGATPLGLWTVLESKLPLAKNSRHANRPF